MARQKTNKTAIKRIKKTNPRGNRKAKLIFKQSAQHHLRVKRSARSKRRKSTHSVVDKTVAKKFTSNMTI
ncbi:MAG: hypothetical protein Fur003_1530 [Candidatus Dojkabacteria bacterium]